MAAAGGHRDAMADRPINRRDIDLASAGTTDQLTARDGCVDCRDTAADAPGRANNDVADDTPGDRRDADLALPVPPEKAAAVDPTGCCRSYDHRFINSARYGRHHFIGRMSRFQEHTAMSPAITGGRVRNVAARRLDHDVPLNGPVNAAGTDFLIAFDRAITAPIERGCRLRHQERDSGNGRRENCFCPHEAHNSKQHCGTVPVPWAQRPFNGASQRMALDCPLRTPSAVVHPAGIRLLVPAVGLKSLIVMW